MTSTHEVFNQVPPLVGHNTAADPALREGLEREGAGWALPEIDELGRLAGTEEAQAWGRLAERVPPRLHTHDRYGRRVDEVEDVPEPTWRGRRSSWSGRSMPATAAPSR